MDLLGKTSLNTTTNEFNKSDIQDINRSYVYEKNNKHQKVNMSFVTDYTKHD